MEMIERPVAKLKSSKICLEPGSWWGHHELDQSMVRILEHWASEGRVDGVAQATLSGCSLDKLLRSNNNITTFLAI